MSRSIKAGTRRVYSLTWDKWKKFIEDRYKCLASPDLLGVRPEVAVNLLIAFMANMHTKGLRGNRVKEHMSHIKAEMIFRGYPVHHFDDPRYSKALKGARYTTEEVKHAMVGKLREGQLPMSLDMILSVESCYWPHEGAELTTKILDRCAVYLCIAMGFNSGRRISSFTHADKKSEDHCIRTDQVHFCFYARTVSREFTKLPAGPNFRKVVRDREVQVDAVKQVEVLFLTQKTTSGMSVTLEKPIIIGRSNEREIKLLTQLFQWCNWSLNDSQDEVFTRNHGGVRSKKLIRKQVVHAIKFIAKEHHMDPSLFSCHSLRRGHATIMENIQKDQIPMDNGIAGWAQGSKVPSSVYSRTTLHGPYAYDNCDSSLTANEIKAMVLSGDIIGGDNM